MARHHKTDGGQQRLSSKLALKPQYRSGALSRKNSGKQRQSEEQAQQQRRRAEPATGAGATNSVATLGSEPLDANNVTSHNSHASGFSEACGSSSAQPEQAESRFTHDAELQRYWSALRQADPSPRFHEDDLNLIDKVLRQFDLDAAYGPFLGITRTARWTRASKLGLRPPPLVKRILDSELGQSNRYRLPFRQRI